VFLFLHKLIESKAFQKDTEHYDVFISVFDDLIDALLRLPYTLELHYINGTCCMHVFFHSLICRATVC
jgi:hypothetical protein